MTRFGKALQRVRPKGRKGSAGREANAVTEVAQSPPIDIAPNDPVIAYFQTASGAVDLDSLDLESPAVEALKEAGVARVYTPKDFEITRIMGDIVDLVAEHHAAAAAA